MELGGVLRGGLELTPEEVLQNFLGVSYLLREVKPPDPRQIQPCLFLREKITDFVINLIELLNFECFTNKSDTIRTDIQTNEPKLAWT